MRNNGFLVFDSNLYLTQVQSLDSIFKSTLILAINLLSSCHLTAFSPNFYPYSGQYPLSVLRNIKHLYASPSPSWILFTSALSFPSSKQQ